MKKLLANNIKKYYGKDDCIVKAVDDISLEIECGKFTSIVGTSGSGKSTLLRRIQIEVEENAQLNKMFVQTKKQKFNCIFN